MSTDGVPLINSELVSRLIEEQFPRWAHLPIQPVQLSGWDNRTFHLGEHMLVRLPSAERYSFQVAKEQKWLPKLAPLLPLPIPEPLAIGKPTDEYPLQWSIYRWLNGETASIERITDLSLFAESLGAFLKALQKIDSKEGPPAGPHNFYRGGPLTVYEAQTRQALDALEGKIDTDAANEIWKAAIATTWQATPVWVHGDVAVGNLLVNQGQLSAVIDFGSSGVGDPACDLAIAWTFFKSESREAFRRTLSLDDGTWARGRAWALWKALIVVAELPGTNPREIEPSQQVLREVLTDYKKELIR